MTDQKENLLESVLVTLQFNSPRHFVDQHGRTYRIQHFYEDQGTIAIKAKYPDNIGTNYLLTAEHRVATEREIRDYEENSMECGIKMWKERDKDLTIF